MDQDKDKKITILDKVSKPFLIQSTKVEGTYYLSNLLQELKLLEDQKETKLKLSYLQENPVARLTRTIKERFWSGLTRKIDADHLETVIQDSKVQQGNKLFLYVPQEDEMAQNYFRQYTKTKKKIEIKLLPRKFTPEYVRSLNGSHGLLSLAMRKNGAGNIEAVPYVVPGGRFNEMYGWDSYFIALGLINDGKIQLAKDMVDNHVFEIKHYGKILNANRSYYLTRSQPPFLTSMIRAVFEKLPLNKESREWLKRSLLVALKEYQEVWMGKDRLTEMGLSRYSGHAPGIPPEVEKGHFNDILAPYAKKHQLPVTDFELAYEQGKIKEPELDEFFMHDRAVRESGHDTTYRWRVGGKDRCSDFVTVDLNSLLMKYELDFAYFTNKILKNDFPHQAKYFLKLANKRKALINKYLWDEKEKLFFDYNTKKQKRSAYVSATTFYPLWAFDPEFPEQALLEKSQAHEMVSSALKQLEAPGGLTSTSKESLVKFGDLGHERQWEYPNGWAPHQMLAWSGLRHYGMEESADRLSYNWLLMIVKNAADYNGTIPEKFDVVKKSHAVFAEYGNVGTEFDYITYEGFGWMNASFQVGLSQLNEKHKKNLEKLVPFIE